MRHTVTLLITTGLVALVDSFGAAVDKRTYVVFGVWIGVNFWMGPWAARPFAYERRLTRYALTVVIDILFLGAVYVFLNAAQWLGAMFFTHMALVASATLSRRWVIGIAVLIVVVYAGVMLLEVTGMVQVVSPVNLAPIRGQYLFAIASTVAAAGLIAILMLLQSRLIATIRDAEQRYLTLVRAAPDMLMTFDDEGHFTDVNPATLEQSGYTWEEIKRLPNTSFFPADDWVKVREALGRNLRGEVVRLEVRFVRKGGEVRWVQTTSAPYARGDRQAVLVIARDVTDARRQTDALRANEERFRLILDSLDLGFYTIDDGQRITAIFGRWAREHPDRCAAMIGREVGAVMPGDLGALHMSMGARALAGEDVTFTWDMHRPADGELRHYRNHLVRLHDETGKVVGAAGLWIDETPVVQAQREREALKERVADAERVESLGKLVSGVAHELNNPLAAILNFTEDLLADRRTDDEKVALEVIQAQALRSRTIVRDLLTYVRRGERRERQVERPGAILETLVRAVRPGLATQGVKFAAQIMDPDTPLLIDRTGFEQVVTNLLTNAAQAAGPGGDVHLSARRHGGSYAVTVEDSGPGIPGDHFDRIFEPFFTTKPTGQGVGLGLSVSLGIVRAHGGELTAENMGPSMGARFTMRLPIADSPAPTPPVEAGSSGAPPERRPGILIVDDEESIRRGLRRYFTRRGWNVDEAADGREALEKLRRPDALAMYDVVLCDLKMPGVNGIAVFQALEEDAPAVASRFIFSTGDVSAPDVAGFLAGVRVPVLEKPFELVALERLANRVRTATAATTPAGRGPA